MSEGFEFPVPGTCAHLGPGYGVLGLALDIPLDIQVSLREEKGHRVLRTGDISHAPQDPRHDPILRAMNAAAERYKIKLPDGLEIQACNRIPAYAGLGTNAASFAAGFGIALRHAKAPPDADAVIDLLVELGGTAAHGGAALYGGLVACSQVRTPAGRSSHRVFRYSLDPGWRVEVVCPDRRLGAAEAIRALPATLPHGVVKRTSSRLMGLLHALAVGDPDLLKPCLADEVHVPFRRNLVDGLGAALDEANSIEGAAATISGAGPALVVLGMETEAVGRAASAAKAAFADAGVAADSLAVGTLETGALPVD